jgi:prophage regulatory protein
MSNEVPSLLRLRDVVERVRLSRSHLYALIQSGQFPKPIKLTERVSVWPEAEVSAWIADRIQASRKAAA